MENETELTFLSCVKPKLSDIVSGEEKDESCIRPVKWTNEVYGSLEKNKNNERSREMLRMICKEFRMREAAIPTHFRFQQLNENGDPTGQRPPGHFNRSRLCTLIRDGYLKALTRRDVAGKRRIYGAVPTQKGLEFVKSHQAR